MRINKIVSRRAARRRRRSGSMPARPVSRPRSRATRRCPRRRARASSSCRPIRPIAAGSNSRDMPPMVAQAMQAQGYVPAASPQTATMLVRVDYGVDKGQQEVDIDPLRQRLLPRRLRRLLRSVLPSRLLRPALLFALRRLSRPRALLLRLGRSVLGLVLRQRRGVYTVYKSFLDLDIRRHVGQCRHCSKARPRPARRPTICRLLVPNLIEAMFTGFPGRTGETVRITVPPPPAPRG